MRALMKAAVLLLASLVASLIPDAPPDSAGPADRPVIRAIVRHPLLTAGLLAFAGAVAAALVVVSGVVPIRASSGHWQITAWLLDFAKVRSVATYSLGLEVPPLDDPALVLRGAAHYEGGCATCHGRPGGGIPPVMAAMTPVPPGLSDGRLARWKAEQLFTIVKHGIKLTGMPAWPAQQRDDEVWAVVAFLRKIHTFDRDAYRTLVFDNSRNVPGGPSGALTPEEQQKPRAVRDVCERCHGATGAGRGPGTFPHLAGQRSAYLHGSLRAFADRQRFSGIMSTIAASLSDDTMREVSDYYARLPPPPAAVVGDPAAVSRGDAIADRGLPDRDIPSCTDCHGPGVTPRNPTYPILASQDQRYLALQLELFKERRRGGSPYVNLMHVFVDRLDRQQIHDVTLYFSSLPAHVGSSPTGTSQ
jgi:cytochrome c553